MIAIVAAMRAGAAYLPLDPEWPVERLSGILDDAGCTIVAAGPTLADLLDGPGRTIVTSERVGADNDDAPAQKRESAPEDLAYVIYTSGSTGAPKGVEITHAGLASLVAWHLDAFELTNADRVAWVGGLGFDASVWELAPALAARACICIPDETQRRSAEALRNWLLEEGVTIAFVPAPFAETMIRAEWPAGCKLRYLLTGGDTLHVRPIAGLPFKVVNNYGPTECTVVATSGVVDPDGEGLPSLGRPLPACRIEIVDEGGAPVAPGVVGEIWVAGPQVARGYRNRPELTSARFVSASPGGGPAERFYRTGDLGSRRDDGAISFHGRCDDQIKHRGHRIEPGEVSAALNAHAAVAQSVVVLQGEGPDARLAAYVVSRGRDIVRSGALHAFLAERLPRFMLPEVFVRLDELPLNTSGKVDKAALPQPSALNALPELERRAPVTATEIRMAALVEELLEVRDVGLDDNFFLLGGHSLLAAQLLLRVRDLFGAELSLRDLFEAQTIQRLAARVERAVEAMVAAMSEEELHERLAVGSAS